MDYDVFNLPPRITLGKNGENYSKKISIDISKWDAEYPNATYALVYQRSDDVAYAVTVERTSNTIVWRPSATDLKPGYGKLEIRMYQGAVIAKSLTVITYVADSIDVGDVPTEETPDWAKKIINAYEGVGHFSDYYNLKNPVKYRVGLCSDIHVGYFDGKNDFKRALNKFHDIGCDFVGFCGDIQSLSVPHFSEYEQFLEVMEEAPYIKGETFFACRGNHDVFLTDEQWKTTTGCGTNYYFEKDGDIFLFLSPSYDGAPDDGNWVVDWNEAATYLESIISDISGNRIFAFVHYPFYGHAGVQPNKAYGFKENDTNGMRIYNLLKKESAIIFGGHSHISFRDESKQSNLNIDRDETNHFATVHLMSTAQARDYNYSETKIHDDSVSEITIMDVCDGYVVLHCVDVVRGEIINSYVMFDDLGYTRKGLLDNVYTYSENTKYNTEVATGKTAYSNLFPTVSQIDSAVISFHKKALLEIITKPTNQISISIDTDGAVYNEVGYKEGCRLNSNGGENEKDGYGATGYIPITATDTLYLYGCNLVGNQNTGNDYCAVYDSAFSKLASMSTMYMINSNLFAATLDDDGYVESIGLGNYSKKSQVAYIRFSASGIGANAIITKNQEM